MAGKKIKFKTGKKKISYSYVAFVTLLTLVLAVVMKFSSDIMLQDLKMIYSFVILLAVVLIGILFDIIGISVTSVAETHFHAMAADKVFGAKEAISLIKNAEKVSNICNDVIGDVCGIISGSISAFIVATVFINSANMLPSLLLTGAVSAITVGGKAIGKFIAMSYSSYIVYYAGKIIRILKFGRGK